jgi:hypothetical protein
MSDSKLPKPVTERSDETTEPSSGGNLAEALLDLIKEKKPRLGLILSNPENLGQGTKGLKGC